MRSPAEPARADALRRELDVLSRHLAGRRLGDRAHAYWAAWHAERGDAEAARAPAIDRALVATARAGLLGARLADAYAARFRRAGLLRRKLVLVLALLESSSPGHELVDRPRGAPGAAAWARLALAGAGEAAALLAALVVIGPVHAALSLAGPCRGAGGGAP